MLLGGVDAKQPILTLYPSKADWTMSETCAKMSAWLAVGPKTWSKEKPCSLPSSADSRRLVLSPLQATAESGAGRTRQNTRICVGNDILLYTRALWQRCMNSPDRKGMMRPRCSWAVLCC